MTVCVSALADSGKAIVCVADKAVTWDENIQWESDSSKIVVLNPSGAVVSSSGSEDAISRMLRKMQAVPHTRDVGAYIDECENRYKKCFEEMVTIEFLNQNLLTRAEYSAAVSKREINEHMQDLAEQIAEYELDCDLLAGGFDKDKKPFLLFVTSPGVVTDMSTSGFEAIGSGSDRATPRMLWNDYKKSDPIDKVLYDAFDAKANAEMNVGVGYEWDATIAFPGKTVSVPENIKTLLEKAWNDP